MEWTIQWKSRIAGGELCDSDTVREQWLETLLPPLRLIWSGATDRSYYWPTTACLSVLLSLGRHEELLDLVTSSSIGLWHVRRFGVKALVGMGRWEEAVRYAEASRNSYGPDRCVDQECEH